LSSEKLDSREDGATKSINVVESNSSRHKGSNFEEPAKQRDSEEEEEDDDEQRDNLEKYSISSITIPDYILSAS